MHACICVYVAAVTQLCLDMLAWVCHICCGARALPCPALPCPALPCPALPCPALPCPAQFERGQKFAHIHQYKCHPVEVQMCICAVYAVWGGSYG